MDDKQLSRIRELSGVQNANFRSKIERDSISIYGGTEKEEYVLQAMVEWNAEPEYRSWGIKSIEPTVYSVNIMLEEGDIDTSKYSTKIEYETTNYGPSLYPKSIDVDIKREEIIVYFVK